jgi:hypothetical protein
MIFAHVFYRYKIMGRSVVFLLDLPHFFDGCTAGDAKDIGELIYGNPRVRQEYFQFEKVVKCFGNKRFAECKVPRGVGDLYNINASSCMF